VRCPLFARPCLTISRWTKLAGKKGPNYDEVIQRLKDVDFPRRAEKYAELEKALVDHKVKVLLAEAQPKPVM
jgi:hypothetical protein